MDKIHCGKNCQAESDNNRSVFCPIFNNNPEINFWKILNGTLVEKIESLRQTTDDEII